MELNKFKAENFWLRVGLTIVIMGWLSSLAVMNKNVTSVKTTTDSTAIYKLKCDSLQNRLDSANVMIDFDNDQIGKRDMIIEQAKDASPRMMNELIKNTEGLSYEK